MIRLSAPRRPPLLPLGAAATCAPAVLAALLALAIAAAAALGGEERMLSRQARQVAVAVSGDVARAPRIAAMLGARRDVASVAIAAPADGATPTLIDATLAEGASADGVRRSLAGLPGIAVAESGAAVRPLARTIAILAHAAIGIAAAAWAAAVAASLVATRGALTTGQATLEMIERLGTTDTRIAGSLARDAAWRGLIGGVLGTAAGGLVVLIVAMQAAAIDRAGAGASSVPVAWPLLATTPLLIAAAAMLGAYGGALALLARRR